MNGTFSPAISLKEIDPDTLVSIEDNREAIEFGVKLSSSPGEVWTGEFEQVYHRGPREHGNAAHGRAALVERPGKI